MSSLEYLSAIRDPALPLPPTASVALADGQALAIAWMGLQNRSAAHARSRGATGEVSMKMRLVLLTAVIVAAPAAPASAAAAGVLVSPLIAPQNSIARVATTPTNWALYCRTIRNWPHRQQCYQEHNIPYPK
jgi:hypothetical protein